MNIHSFNGYGELNQTLEVTPMLYNDLFDPAPAGHDDLQQTYGLRQFSSRQSVSFSWGKDAWRQSYAAGFNADVQQLSSGLSAGTQGNIPDTLVNDIHRNQFEWTASAQYTYTPGRKLRITSTLPVEYQFVHTNRNQRRFYFNPSANIDYKFAIYWNAMLGFRLNHSMSGIRDEYTHDIMTSYRNLTRNDGQLYEQQSQNYNLYLNYRNPLKTWFFSMNANYARNRANQLYAYEYEGILRLRKTIDIPCVSKNVNIGMSISKEVEALASVISLRGNYSNMQSLLANQGEISPFSSHSWNFSPGINTKINQHINFSYQASFNRMTSKIENSDVSLSPVWTMSHKPSINLFPAKNMSIYIGYEYFRNSAITEGSRNMSFGDAGLRYKWKKAELQIDYTNMFNTRRYVSASYSETSRYYYAYDLRPAEVLVKVRFKIK